MTLKALCENVKSKVKKTINNGFETILTINGWKKFESDNKQTLSDLRNLWKLKKKPYYKNKIELDKVFIYVGVENQQLEDYVNNMDDKFFIKNERDSKNG